MYKHTINIRVRYAETDKMGYVYYGNYATYFEVGRVELLRSLGISYRKLEEQGILLPVVNLNVDYKKPAFYDDNLTLETILTDLPGVKIVFHYALKRGEELLSKAQTTLVFLNAESGRPVKCPEEILNELAKL
ncbi:MAG TPA: thioesterase [Flavobacteriales bacterium]|nr:thioesterase [Flavobacteriales bacterium]